jgi:hypothetical protein
VRAPRARTSCYARCRIPGPRSPVPEVDHAAKSTCGDEDTAIETHTVVDIGTREIVTGVEAAIVQTSTALLGSDG